MGGVSDKAEVVYEEKSFKYIRYNNDSCVLNIATRFTYVVAGITLFLCFSILNVIWPTKPKGWSLPQFVRLFVGRRQQ